ncbi:MAG: hypothetical protein JKY93_00775 [Gammaproteobacteria bacterium]|nr:hypothetical protein [Gammaproteobacteria bacterium]
MATVDNIYVDGDAVINGNGRSTSTPYNNIKNVHYASLDLHVGGGTTVHIAGDNYIGNGGNGLTMKTLVAGAFSNNHVWQQWVDMPTARVMGGILCTNNSDYQWNASASNVEYYLSDIGNPSALTGFANTPDSGTLDGYYRSDSVSPNNKALEQIAYDVADGAAPVIGSMPDDCFGWGDNDTLGFDTVYIKTKGIKVPSDYELIMSDQITAWDCNTDYHEINDIQILFGITSALRSSKICEVNRCVIGNAEFRAVEGKDAGCDLTINNCILTQGHRAYETTGTATPSVKIYNSVMHNNHLGVRNDDSLALIDVKNCLSIGGESGFAEMVVSTAGFTESHNYMYPRLNDTTQKIGYINAANWAATADSSIPSNYDTDAVIADTSITLLDPKIVRLDLHDFNKCDFSLMSGSPLIGAGVPISGLTTDYVGETYHAVSPNIGIHAGSSGSTGSNGKFVEDLVT